MGKFFSDPVEQALEYIYYNERAGKGRECFANLVRTAAAGDGDACCILARCLSGYQYVWSGHGFPEDEGKAKQMLQIAVERGSAIGVLVALRCGELTPELEARMPFDSLQSAFSVVLEKAEGGDAFCQYTIGNAYFWQDFLRIQGKDRDSFPDEEAYRAYMRENISQCEGWFHKALQGGIYFAANNLNRYYTKGEEDIIPPQPEKAKDLWKTGAERGYPIHQIIYARDLEKAGQKAEALKWFQLAAEGGQPGAWYEVGRMYFDGEGAPKNEKYACECFEKELPRGNIGSHNLLGKAYFYGRGVPQDYGRAFQLLSFAYEESNKGTKKNNWGVYYLGKCYFEGWGVQQDYQKAREFLEQMDWEYWDANYMLGMIYAQGLGVPADIKRGVAYLQKSADHPEVQEELQKYRKTLFGKWVRR